jgi:predicted nucleic acid-binding protein
VRAFVDTNVPIRHLTGDPAAMATRATRFLAADHELLLPDLVVAEIVFVLESKYELPRGEIALRMRALLALNTIVTISSGILLRALEIYESDRISFADAYLVASAELSGIGTVVSFDKGIDRVGTIRRVEPA